MSRIVLMFPPAACTSVWESVMDVLLLYGEGNPGLQRSSGVAKIHRVWMRTSSAELPGWGLLTRGQAGVHKALDFQRGPCTTQGTAAAPDPDLDLDLGQTQLGASSVAFPPCLMAPSQWITPHPDRAKA